MVRKEYKILFALDWSKFGLPNKDFCFIQTLFLQTKKVMGISVKTIVCLLLLVAVVCMLFLCYCYCCGCGLSLMYKVSKTLYVDRVFGTFG